MRDIPDEPNDVAIVKTEGMEAEAQRTLLVESVCAILQGYLFSRPQPGDELKAFVISLVSP